MECFKLYFIVIVAFCATPFCIGQNNSNAQVSDTTSTEGEKTALQKGMDPIFDLYHNFLDAVMPYNFYDSNDAPFSVQDLIDVLKKDNYDKVQEDWQDLVKTFGGFAACMICGFLFVVFMPLVGCVYCCCHCCCRKCGGTRAQRDPKNAKCKRVTYTSLLLIFTTLMLAGAIITFLGAELLHRSLRNDDNEGLMGGLDQSLGHMQTFVNDTLRDIQREARKQIIEEGLDGILKSITKTAITTADRVQNAINATSLLTEATNVGEVAEAALTNLKAVSVSLTTLTVLQTNVTTTLSGVKTRVDSVCSGTSSQCGTVQGSLANLIFQPNFTSLDKLSAELGKLEQANNITGLVDQARNEFTKVSDDVNKTIETQITGANKEIDDLTRTISDALKSLDGISADFVSAMADGKSFATDEEENIRKAGNYIWYACIGMACAVLLVVVFYYFGVLFGLCGGRPTPDAACCNKGTGANLICVGVCCTFLFCWLLMLVVIITFTLGGLSYSMACKYLDSGVEHVDTFENVVSEGFGWNISKTFNTTNLTLAGMLENCKDNQGVYTALNLKHLFDIDKELNITSVEHQVLAIVNTTNVNINNITLLSPDLKQQLQDFVASNISAVNYTAYIAEAEKALFSGDLGDTITHLNTTANNIQSANATVADELRTAAAELQVVQDVVQPEIEQELGTLKTSVISLEQNSNVTAQVDSLITNIKNSEDVFNENRTTIVNDQLKIAAEGILASIGTTVNNTKEAIKFDIGRCRSLYNAANSVVQSVCVVTLDPLNAIWFGLGWSLFFYIPSFIFAVLLASLYRRQDKYMPQYKADFDGVGQAPYSGYDNGYHGGPREEHYPLTSVNNSRSQDKVGTRNYAYEGREYEPDPRYHRDSHDAQPYHVSYPGQAAGRDSRGPAQYARPHAGSQNLYDGYEPSMPPHYDDVTAHGRSRGDHGGYPKIRNY